MTATKFGMLKKKVSQTVTVAEKTMQSAPCFVALMVMTAIAYGVTIFMNFLAGNPHISRGLFIHGIGNVSNMYSLNITPAGWAFSIWGLIYLWQAGWIFYSLSLICQSTPDGPAYLNPVVLSPGYFFFFLASCLFNVSWLFLWDRLFIIASCLFLFMTAVSVTMSLTVAAARLSSLREGLIDLGRKQEVRYIEVLACNGLAMYATWTVVATFLNLGSVLVYKWQPPLPNESASVLCLGVLAFIIVIFVGSDLTVLDRYLRYTFTPYVTLAWALAAILAKNWDKDHASSITAAIMLGCVAVAFVVKLGFSFRRHYSLINQYRLMRASRRS